MKSEWLTEYIEGARLMKDDYGLPAAAANILVRTARSVANSGGELRRILVFQLGGSGMDEDLIPFRRWVDVAAHNPAVPMRMVGVGRRRAAQLHHAAARLLQAWREEEAYTDRLIDEAVAQEIGRDGG